MNALCLKCASVHKCKEVQYIEKYTSAELEIFFRRLGNKDEKTEVQSSLSKLNIRYPESGCGEKIKYDIEY